MSSLQDQIITYANYVYDYLVDGVQFVKEIPGLTSAHYLAESCSSVPEIVTYQCIRTGFIGFLAGLPGGPVAFFAMGPDIAHSIFVNIRMVLAIAIKKGYDPKKEAVKVMVLGVLVSNSVSDFTKHIGTKIGLQVGKRVLQKVPGRILIELNKKIGFRMFTKFGKKGVINFVQWIPIIGGVVGAGVNATETALLGNIADQVFA